jgi:hypothetical protein
LKNAFIIIFLIINTIASATDYYISSSGNDSNNGLSSSKPWKTIAKVNASYFLPGDTIFFNKGDTWRETLIIPSSGTSANYITFGAYGIGNAPKILGSSLVTAWTNRSGNVWKSIANFTNPALIPDYGNIYFKETSGSITWGRVEKATTWRNCVTEYDWYWHGDTIYIYSPTNPNNRYSGVEVSQRQTCVNLDSKTYLTFDGIEIAYAGEFGIISLPYNSLTNISGLIVKNCDIHHFGSKRGFGGLALSLWYSDMLIQNNTIHDASRRNISLNLDANVIQAHDIIIENNTMYDAYHTSGVDINTTDAGTWDNIIIRKNLIYQNTLAVDAAENPVVNLMFLAVQGTFTGSVTNVYVYNNIFKNNNLSAITIEHVNSVFIYNNTFYGFSTGISDQGLTMINVYGVGTSIIKNNIFYDNMPSTTSPYTRCFNIISGPTVTMDYNLYYVPDASQIIGSWHTTYYPLSKWATYKSASSQDAHSPTPANPLFVSSSDYHLQAGSPAIDAGIDVGLPFSGKAPDIGALETQSESITPIPPVFSSAVVENVTPSLLEMTYDLTLNNLIVPAGSAFNILVNSISRSVNSVAISGNKVQLTLANPVVHGDIITVDYTKPSINPLQTTSGGIATSISNQPVVNNCIYGTTTVNQPPVVTISNPSKGNKFEKLATIVVDAIATDPDGTIIKVEFYSGTNKLVELTSPPYSYTWKDVAAGTYTLTAIATDNLNATTTSSPVEFVVGPNIKYDANSEIINLYPNPNDGLFSIEFVNPLQNERNEIVITDLAGKQVYNGHVSKEETIKQIDLSYIKSGIYILMIIYKRIIVTKKIIKY